MKIRRRRDFVNRLVKEVAWAERVGGVGPEVVDRCTAGSGVAELVVRSVELR
jgi:hypothetical protein